MFCGAQLLNRINMTNAIDREINRFMLDKTSFLKGRRWLWQGDSKRRIDSQINKVWKNTHVRSKAAMKTIKSFFVCLLPAGNLYTHILNTVIKRDLILQESFPYPDGQVRLQPGGLNPLLEPANNGITGSDL